MPKKETGRPKVNIKGTTVHIAVLGLLTALAAVLSLFTLRPIESIKISFTFIPVAMAAYLYGPLGGGAVAGLADIIGCIVRPAGMIFPPITLTEVAVGLVFGLLLHKKRSIPRILGAAAVSQLIFSLFVTPIWLNMLYGTDYSLLLFSRIPQIGIMLAVQPVLIWLILKSLEKINVWKYLPSVVVPAGTKKNASEKLRKACEKES